MPNTPVRAAANGLPEKTSNRLREARDLLSKARDFIAVISMAAATFPHRERNAVATTAIEAEEVLDKIEELLDACMPEGGAA